MYKICAVIHPKTGLSREEFKIFWEEEHPAVVVALPNIRKYIQNVAIPHKTDWPFWGVAEVYFDSLTDIAAAFASPQADLMREHEKKFAGEIEWIITEQREILMNH